jgi:hypothetical protein
MVCTDLFTKAKKSLISLRVTTCITEKLASKPGNMKNYISHGFTGLKVMLMLEKVELKQRLYVAA